MAETARPHSTQLRAIIFDCDGVLVDSEAASSATYRNLIRAHGHQEPSNDALQASAHLTLEDRIAYLLGRPCDATELADYKRTLQRPGIRRPQLLRVPQGVEPVLAQLRQSYQLGIATSRSRLGMQDVFEFTPLRQYFDVVVVREDYDKPKPSPEPLLRAAQLLGVPPTACAYVGDSPSDIEAALAAGMAAYYLNHRSMAGAAHIRSFDELVSLLDK